jgi:hypothetical protein
MGKINCVIHQLNNVGSTNNRPLTGSTESTNYMLDPGLLVNAAKLAELFPIQHTTLALSWKTAESNKCEDQKKRRTSDNSTMF